MDGSIFTDVSWGGRKEKVVNRITAIFAYYPSCLSGEWPCGHDLALRKLNSSLWVLEVEGTQSVDGWVGRYEELEFGTCNAIRGF